MKNTEILLYLKQIQLDLQEIKKELIRLDSRCNENQLYIFKELITKKHFPLNIKKKMYKKYKDMGGNSWVDNYVQHNYSFDEWEYNE